MIERRRKDYLKGWEKDGLERKGVLRELVWSWFVVKVKKFFYYPFFFVILLTMFLD